MGFIHYNTKTKSDTLTFFFMSLRQAGGGGREEEEGVCSKTKQNVVIRITNDTSFLNSSGTARRYYGVSSRPELGKHCANHGMTAVQKGLIGRFFSFSFFFSSCTPEQNAYLRRTTVVKWDLRCTQ